MRQGGTRWSVRLCSTLVLVLSFVLVGSQWTRFSAQLTSGPRHEPFGTLLGISDGQVQVYSCDSATSPLLPQSNNLNGIFTGLKWQCVELARRWLLVNEGWVFDDVDVAFDIFSLTFGKRLDGTKVDLKSYSNGSRVRPRKGSMIIWKKGGAMETTGHVAISVEVSDSFVRVVEQNVFDAIWPQGQNFSRELFASVDEHGGYWITDSFFDEKTLVLGWIHAANPVQGESIAR